MRNSNADDSLSPATVELLSAVVETAPGLMTARHLTRSELIRYLCGLSEPDEAFEIELAAVSDAASRRQMEHLATILGVFQDTPYGLLPTLPTEGMLALEAKSEWIRAVDRNVEVVCGNLVGTVPTTWPAISKMAKQGLDGFFAAKTIWRAMFATRKSPHGRAPLQLGFGYRRGSRGAVEPVRILTRLEGEVTASGDMAIEAATDLGPNEGAIFFAYSMNGRALPLAEAAIRDGQASVTVEGLGQFLGLPAGPIPGDTLTARLNDWPEICKLGQVMIEADGVFQPRVEIPVVMGGDLVVDAYFEDASLDGKWELLLAVTPNCWQMLTRFDIKYPTGRPQVLKAMMPSTAKDGPFGGALWLRRHEPQVR